MNDLNQMMKTIAIYRILKSKQFFQFCAFLVLLGTAWYIYFTFIDKTNSQDAILQQLIENNQQVDTLNKKVAELNQTICVLQDQIESLGAIPAVEKSHDCIDNESDDNAEAKTN